jgi:gliding motility-associated-like protein
VSYLHFIDAMRAVVCITHILLFLFGYVSVFSQTYVTNGSASNLGNGCYAVTPATNFQNGTVWYSQQLNLNNPFDIQFFMNFGSNDAQGADGMVFVLQQQGVNAIGVNGSGMGYQGFFPSFGVEFDTYSNNADPFTGQNMNDPLFDHVAFLRNGDVNHITANNLAGPVQASATNANIEDNQDHLVRLVWDPSTFTITLFFDCEQRLTRVINLIGEIFTSSPFVYFGFTGSTGGFNNLQSVCLNTNILPSNESVTICEGGSVQLSAGGDGDFTFNWSPNIAIDDVTSQTPTVNPSQTTTYTVEYTDLCNNVFTREFEVIVEPAPVVDAGLDGTFCEGEMTTLAGSVSGGNIILWNTPDGNIVSGNSTLTPEIDAPGTYTLSAENDAGCSASDIVVFTITPLPALTIAPNFDVCPNEVVVIDLGNNYDLIEWSNGSNATEQSFGAGNHSVTVTTNDCSATAEFDVNTIAVPEINLGADIEACEGNVITLEASGPVEWSTGAVAQEIEVTENGTYSASIEVQGCADSDEIEVTFYPYPTIEIPETLGLCEGETITITSNVQGLWNTGVTSAAIDVNSPGTYSLQVTSNNCTSVESTEVIGIAAPQVELGEDIVVCLNESVRIGSLLLDAYTYEWNDGSTNSTLNIFEPGTYSVIASNECGSIADTVEVSFEECNYYIFIPNTFTPDADGTNDVWKVEAFNLDSYELQLFDRWGNVVFTSTDPDEVWTGEVNGGDYFARNGIYNYIIRYTAENLDAQVMKGHVLLMR